MKKLTPQDIDSIATKIIKQLIPICSTQTPKVLSVAEKMAIASLQHAKNTIH